MGKETDKFTRDELMAICYHSVVHHEEWSDRDSYLAQKMVKSVLLGLSIGLEFEVYDNIDGEVKPKSFFENESDIWIKFTNPNNIKPYCNDNAKILEISDIEDYRRDCDPDHSEEMFDNPDKDFEANDDEWWCYMPTPALLDYLDGRDWCNLSLPDVSESYIANKD